MQPCQDEPVTSPSSARNSQRRAQRNHAESTFSHSHLAAPSQALQPNHEAARRPHPHTAAPKRRPAPTDEAGASPTHPCRP
eukprot:1458039-Alexandrium_andersonii.AAC.1